MPPEPAGLPGIYICSHGPRPVGPVNACEPAHHGVHHVREPVAALQCIAAVARGPRYRCQFASSLAMDRGQVIRVARHLAGLAQAPCNLFSFFYVHITLSHKSTSNCAPCRGPGSAAGCFVYESRMSSIIARFSSVAGTTKQAVPTTCAYSRQLETRSFCLAFIHQ